jgi:hypothetical protein
VLGINLEALDSIRMESEVYIILLASATDGHPTLRIMGQDQAKASAARQHVENFMAQLDAKFFEVEALHICLVETGDQVWLYNYRNRPNDPPGVGIKLRGIEAENRAAILDQSMIDAFIDDRLLALMKHRIGRSLDAIRHQKKTFSMNVHLGVFILTGAIREDRILYSHEEFIKLMENAEGDVETFVTDS